MFFIGSFAGNSLRSFTNVSYPLFVKDVHTMRTPDCTTPKPSYSGQFAQEPKHLKRNVLLGASTGILCSALLVTKGNLKNLPKIDYGIKEVMAICTGSALGGYLGASATTPINKKGRALELRNQLLYNDFIPLILLKIADVLFKFKNKLHKSIALVGALLAATYFGHYLCERNLKTKGLKTNYPVKACHLLADFDDFLLPIAIATKSRGLQQFLKCISPVTFAPLGMDVGLTKDSKYYSASSSFSTSA